MKTKFLVRNVGVDAGVIAVCDRNHYIKHGGDIDKQVIDGTPLSQVIKVEPGKYLVSWKIPQSWNGPISGKANLEVTTGEVVVSDPCYCIKNNWAQYLNKTGYCEKNLEDCFYINEMGGDGVYTVNLNFKKIG